jgi:hypothetical protein
MPFLLSRPDQRRAVAEPVMIWKISTGGQELSFFSIMSRLGTPLEATLAELTLEMFFPADTATQQFLQASAADQAAVRCSGPSLPGWTMPPAPQPARGRPAWPVPVSDDSRWRRR